MTDEEKRQHQAVAHAKWWRSHKEKELIKRHGDSALPPFYVSSCSFGKDSLATVILAMQHNEPIDRVSFCEVMYDHTRGISGEMPEHIKWIYEVAMPKLQSWGLQIDVIKAKHDFLSLFHRTIKVGPNKGKIQGFPYMQGCQIEGFCKTMAIKSYYRTLMQQPRPLVQYVGIAADETKRLIGIHNSRNKISLLEKYNVTEAMAKEMCKAEGLLSPIYDVTIRTGCWFCPNRKIKDFARFAKENPNLWKELVSLGKTENMVGTSFTICETIEQIDAALSKYNQQLTFDF